AAAQEACLTRALGVLGRRRGSEALCPDPAGQRGPVFVRLAQRRVRVVRPNAPLHELRADLRGTRASLGARRDEAGYETLTAQQPVLFQPVQGFADEPAREAACGELALELAAAVLAAREQRDRTPLAFDGIFGRRGGLAGRVAPLGLVGVRAGVAARASAEARSALARPVRPGAPHPPPLRPAPRPRPSSAAASRGSSPRSRQRWRDSGSGTRARSPCPGRYGPRRSCTRSRPSRRCSP